MGVLWRSSTTTHHTTHHDVDASAQALCKRLPRISAFSAVDSRLCGKTCIKIESIPQRQIVRNKIDSNKIETSPCFSLKLTNSNNVLMRTLCLDVALTLCPEVVLRSPGRYVLISHWRAVPTTSRRSAFVSSLSQDAPDQTKEPKPMIAPNSRSKRALGAS